MIYKCPECGKIFKRDMRLKISKYFLTPKGEYKSWCLETDKDVKCKPKE